MSTQTQSGAVRTISTDQAKRWIDRHEQLVGKDPSKRNRTVKKSMVDRYARDMREDRWQLNGETIKLSSDGRIIDGQHRLLACIKSKTAFKTWVVQNVDDLAFHSIDVGKVRTGGDLLYIGGIHDGANTAHALGIVWRWEKGGHKTIDWSNSRLVTKPELFEVLERHPTVPDYVRRAGPIGAKVVSRGLAAALWYIFAKKEEELAAVFFDALAAGTNLTPHDPVFILRERLLKEKAQRPAPKQEYLAELIVRAWNATRRGQKLTKLQMKRNDAADHLVEIR